MGMKWIDGHKVTIRRYASCKCERINKERGRRGRGRISPPNPRVDSPRRWAGLAVYPVPISQADALRVMIVPPSSFSAFTPLSSSGSLTYCNELGSSLFAQRPDIGYGGAHARLVSITFD